MNGKNANNVIWLTSVRVMTVLIGIIGTRLLSDSFSYSQYGTYAQLNLLVELFTSFSILGMTDGANYYFSKARDSKDYSYVNATFGLQLLVGATDALILMLLSGNWASIMNNPSIKKYIVWIAFRPLLTNFIAMLTAVNVAIGNSRIIAIRNGFFSVLKLTGIIISINCGNNIFVILAIFLGFDFITVLYFSIMYKKGGATFSISFSPKLWKEIILFCIPIGVYVLVNGLFRSADKFIVSILGDINDVSIYANATAQLPFDIVWTSVQTIAIPIITYNVTNKKKDIAFNNFCSCMRINFIFTVPLVIGAFIVAPELVDLLYGSKYTASVPVFRIYIITEMVKYFGNTVVITSCGKGTYLLKVSTLLLLINCALDILLFSIIGLMGPAIATVIVTIIMVLVFLRKSMQLLENNLISFVRKILLGKYSISVIFSIMVVICLKRFLMMTNTNSIIRAGTICFVFACLILLFNIKLICNSLNSFNEMK